MWKHSVIITIKMFFSETFNKDLNRHTFLNRESKLIVHQISFRVILYKEIIMQICIRPFVFVMKRIFFFSCKTLILFDRKHGLLYPIYYLILITLFRAEIISFLKDNYFWSTDNESVKWSGREKLIVLWRHFREMRAAVTLCRNEWL